MESNNKDIWLVDIVPSYLGKGNDKNQTGYRAKVQLNKVKYNIKKVVRVLGREGVPLDEYQAEAVVRRFFDTCKRLLRQGYTIEIDDFVKVWAKIEGNWNGLHDQYNQQHHKKTIATTPCPTLLQDLDQVKVEVASHLSKDSNTVILFVQDVATQAGDGTITPGDNILIKGTRIKVAGVIDPNNPNKRENGIGVFFVDQNGKALRSPRLDHNADSSITAKVPKNLVKGQKYKLIIRTRSTTNPDYLLQKIRTITAPFLLTPV
jgi:hypothetical protein